MPTQKNRFFAWGVAATMGGMMVSAMGAAPAWADVSYNLTWQALPLGTSSNTLNGSVSFSSLGATGAFNQSAAAAGISQFSITFGGTTYSIANGSIVSLTRLSLPIDPAVKTNIIGQFTDLNFTAANPDTTPSESSSPLIITTPGIPGGPYMLVSVVEFTAQSPELASGQMYVINRFAINQALFSAADTTLGANAARGEEHGRSMRGTWLRAMGNFGSAQNFTFHTGGVIVGHGFQVSPSWTVGFAASSLFATTRGGFGTVDDTMIGATGYGLYRLRRLQVSFSESLGALNTHLRRAAPGAGATATANSSGLFNVTAARAQYRLRRGRFFVEPDLEAAYVHTSTGAMSESGAGPADLRYASLQTDLVRLSSGVTGGMHIDRAFGVIEPYVLVGGFGTLGNTQPGNTETYAGAGFTEYGLASPVAAWTTGVGVNLVGRGPWRAGFRWVGAWGSGTSTQDLGVDFRYVW